MGLDLTWETRLNTRESASANISLQGDQRKNIFARLNS